MLSYVCRRLISAAPRHRCCIAVDAAQSGRSRRGTRARISVHASRCRRVHSERRRSPTHDGRDRVLQTAIHTMRANPLTHAPRKLKLAISTARRLLEVRCACAEQSETVGARNAAAGS